MSNRRLQHNVTSMYYFVCFFVFIAHLKLILCRSDSINLLIRDAEMCQTFPTCLFETSLLTRRLKTLTRGFPLIDHSASSARIVFRAK